MDNLLNENFSLNLKSMNKLNTKKNLDNNVNALDIDNKIIENDNEFLETNRLNNNINNNESYISNKDLYNSIDNKNQIILNENKIKYNSNNNNKNINRIPKILKINAFTKQNSKHSLNINSLKLKFSDDNYNKIIDTSTSINIVILGNNKSGKSSLVDCFTDKIFNYEIYTEHIIRTKIKKLVIENVVFEIIFTELSGNLNRDSEIIQEYLNIANCYILCHEIDFYLNENEINNWLKMVNIYTKINNKDITKYLVGCKLDALMLKNYNSAYYKHILNIDNLADTVISSSDNSDDYDNISNTIYNSNNNYTNNKDSAKINNALTNKFDINKLETSKFELLRTQISDYLEKNNIRNYFYTSALLNFNIDSMFELIIKDYIIDYLSSIKKEKINIESKYGCKTQ